MAANDNITAAITKLSCDLFDNTELCDIVIIVKRVVACVSVLGCLLMLTVIFVYKKYSNFIQRIILYMTLAALLSAIAYIIGDLQEDGPICTFQGFISNFADWSVLMWMFMITLTLHLSQVNDKKLDSKEWVFHIVCWGLPLLASCVPFIDDNHYGPSGAWCWIDDTAWRFGAWYVPLFVMLLVIIVLNSHMFYVVRKRAKNTGGIYSHETEHAQERLMAELKPLRLYPYLYLALNIFPLINRIQNAADSNNPIFALTLLHTISIASQGTVNACAFGLNKQTLSELRWCNFKLQLKSLCMCKTDVIGEYETQEDVPDVALAPDSPQLLTIDQD